MGSFGSPESSLRYILAILDKARGFVVEKVEVVSSRCRQNLEFEESYVTLKQAGPCKLNRGRLSEAWREFVSMIANSRGSAGIEVVVEVRK